MSSRNLTAYILASSDPAHHPLTILDELKCHAPLVERAHATYGIYDVLIKVNCSNLDELEGFVWQTLEKVHIRNSNTCIVLRGRKRETASSHQRGSIVCGRIGTKEIKIRNKIVDRLIEDEEFSDILEVHYVYGIYDMVIEVKKVENLLDKIILPLRRLGIDTETFIVAY